MKAARSAIFTNQKSETMADHREKQKRHCGKPHPVDADPCALGGSTQCSSGSAAWTKQAPLGLLFCLRRLLDVVKTR